VHPEVEELRPKLKEILYDCAVDIRATKAALFVQDGLGRFELVTEYGFRGSIREWADANDPMVDRCGRGRTPFFVNGMAAEPRFSQLLYESSTDRLLAAPLYSRGKLIGLIDMRDKPGKQLFDEGGGFVRTTESAPFGTSAPSLKPADIQKVFTAPLAAGALRGMYLTVAFSGNPERAAHELMGVLHTHMQVMIEQSLHRGELARAQARIAEKLVEPDFAKYPELRRHSELVAQLCESFARQLALTPAEVASARIAGIVHDCGIRLLDYDRLYRKPDLLPEEVSFLREHPLVGAAMVEPLLGSEMARVVLCHHERVDGRGYPSELHGDEIPLLARIVQLCDAWVAMTDPDSYQAPESRESALATLHRTAGEQFDAALVPRFIEMVRGMR